jgi:hypothetical protein
MQLQIDWLLENKVVQFNIRGDVTLEDLSQVSEAIEDFINQSDAPLIHVLHDERGMGSIPSSLKVLTESLGFLKHPRLGWFIIYGNNDRIKKFLSSMVMGIAKIRHRNFETLEESLDFLVTVDSTLPSIQNILR